MSKKNDITLTEEFQLFLKEFYPTETFDLTTVNDQQGAYIDKHVMSMYQGFTRSYRDARKFFFNKHHDRVNIVGMVEGARIKFSFKPIVHRTVELAQAEANRLSEKHKAKYLVFGKISSHSYEPPVVE